MRQMNEAGHTDSDTRRAADSSIKPLNENKHSPSDAFRLPVAVQARIEQDLIDAFENAKERLKTTPPTKAPGPIKKDPAEIIYVICMTPRSGSTFLTDCIYQIGSLGNPTEYFNIHGILQEYASKAGMIDLDSYWDYLVRYRRSPSGIFGMKGDFYQLKPVFDANLLTRTNAEIKFVYLTRQDLIRQGISLHRAMETGSWSSQMKATREVEFDEVKITELIVYIANMMKHWELFFATRRIVPLRITYEEIERNPESVLLDLMKFIGLKDVPSLDGMTAQYRQQRSEKTEAWYERLTGKWNY